MLVLGIDPGTATTGYGVVEGQGDRYRAVAYGCVETAAEIPLPGRLLEIHRRVSELAQAYRPDVLAVEELFFNRNVRTALAVGQARGVVLLAAAQAGLPVAEYTPPEVKQAVVGYGGAEKRQVQEMVKLMLGLEDIPRPDDAADALAVAICCAQSRRMEERLAATGRGAGGRRAPGQ